MYRLVMMRFWGYVYYCYVLKDMAAPNIMPDDWYSGWTKDTKERLRELELKGYV